MAYVNKPENESGNKTIIQCDEVVDIRQVAELKPKLLQALEAANPILIQAETVERADTAGLQLLAAFFIEARARGLDISWLKPSEPLIRSARLIGLEEVLGFDCVLLR